MSVASDSEALTIQRNGWVDEQGAILAAADEENRTLSAEERDRFDTLEATIDKLDGDIANLREEEASDVARRERFGKRQAGLEESAGRRVPPSQPGESVPPKDDDGAMLSPEFGTFGQFMLAVADYFSPGSDPRSENAQKLAAQQKRLTGSPHLSIERLAISGASETIPSEGGFLVAPNFSQQLFKRAHEVGSLLSQISMIPISGNSNGLKIPGIDETSRADGSRWGGIQTYWVTEAGTAIVKKPKFRLIELDLKKLMGLCYTTEELLRDAAAFETVIMQAFPEDLVFTQEEAIVNGTGAGQPQGILNCNAVIQVDKETGQAASTIVYENIVNMFARLWAPSMLKAVWLADQTCLPQLMTMTLDVGTGGVPVYTPPGGASAAPYGQIFNRPVLFHEHGQAVGTAGDLMLADLSQYLMIEKGGIRTDSSMHVRFLYDEMVYRFVYRVDGQPAWNSALTPKSGGDTQSPFVKLQTRS